MPFPQSEREVYKINPLSQVICQLRYPAILRISAEAPFEFQDAVRKDYPLYEEKASFSSNLPQDLPEGIAEMISALPLPGKPSTREHHFFTEDRLRSISLTQEFIAVTDNQYVDWQSFRSQIKSAQGLLQQIYKPTFYERVGLRYIDLLDRKAIGLPDMPWNELLHPSFLGMLGTRGLEEDIQAIKTEAILAVADVEGGLVRVTHGQATALQNGEEVYVIDADFYTDRRSNSDDAIHDLDIFNKWGGHLFRWATKPALRDALGRR